MTTESTPILNSPKGKFTFVDNELQCSIRQLGLFSMLSKSGLRKRSGESLNQIMFALIIWPFLDLKFNWRSICFSLARTVCTKHALLDGDDTAFVVDDTLKHRRGKKVEGVLA